MNALGVRCSNSDFSYVVISGTSKLPEIITTGQVNFPKGFTKAHSVRWFYQEIETLITSHMIKRISIKASEAIKAQKSLEDRIEHEAMIFLAAANHNIRDISKKRKSTIAKDLGVKGKASYLAKLDTTPIPDFDKYNDKLKDAILTAWSELP